VSAGGFDGRGALEAVDRILNRGGDPDDVLRAVLDALHARGIAFARIRLATGDDFAIGSEEPATEAEIAYAGERVGALAVAAGDSLFVERLATLVSAVSAESAKHFRRS
jgi:hypothetical protein